MHPGKIPVHGEGRRKRIKYSSHFVHSQRYCEKKNNFCAVMPVCLYGGAGLIYQKFQFTLVLLTKIPNTSEEMDKHISILAWRIQGSGEPGGLPSMGSDTTEVT